MTIRTTLATVPLASILGDNSGRKVSESHVKELSQSIGASAFLSSIILMPIESNGEQPKFQIIAGGHRVAALRELGRLEINAVIVEDATPDQIELARIDENLLHRPLTPSAEAKALLRRKQIFQKIFPQAKRGGDRRSIASKSQVGRPKNFAAATAAATGRSERSINRATARGENIADSVLSKVSGSKLDNGAFLDELAVLGPDEQEQMVEERMALTDGPEALTSEAAIQNDLRRLNAAWAAASAQARARFISQIRMDVAHV